MLTKKDLENIFDTMKWMLDVVDPDCITDYHSVVKTFEKIKKMKNDVK